MYAVDAGRIARDIGLAGRINVVLQTCFFAISDVLPRDEAITRSKETVAKTYAEHGTEVVQRELAAVDYAIDGLHQIEIPDQVTATYEPGPPVPATAPEFVRTVTAEMIAGRGDALPVGALPVDGTYPSGTAAYEKRNISELVAIWDPDTCIQCGNCTFVCPHSVIRTKFYERDRLRGAPASFPSVPLSAVGLPDTRYTLQVYAEDCTGCGLCVEACPAIAPGTPLTKAINLGPREPIVEASRDNIAFFETLPFTKRSRVDFGTVRGAQFLEPLFEFPGACAGCGETPYLKLLSQLFGDRLMIANATGCSSIYGGNLPTTPWTTNAQGRGPAWSNSLFEDNALFGLGFRLAADTHTRQAQQLLGEHRDALGAELVDEILSAPEFYESELSAQRQRVAELGDRLDRLDPAVAEELRSVMDHLVRRSVWIVGGDGWAYDIGAGGLDHVLASGRNVNVLVLDTIELNVYYLPGDPHIEGREVEQRHLDVLAHVKEAVSVPVAVKLSPFFSSTAEMPLALDEAGADGLVLFNRFLQPDIDCETMTTTPGMTLSTAFETRLPLTWIALLHGRLQASLAATTGVESASEVIKYLLAGADVVQSASALLRHGPEHASVLLDGLRGWMQRKGYTTVEGFRGTFAVPQDGSARERRDYVAALQDANGRTYHTY